MTSTEVATRQPQDVAVDLESANTTQEMARHLVGVRDKLNVVQAFFKDVMVEHQDYGVIPGTEKPALLKAGAEKLCELYGYVPKVHAIERDQDRVTGFYSCLVTMALVSRKTGELVAEGIGEANTMESRYRIRWLFDNQVPAGIDKNTLQSRTQYSKKLKKNFTMYQGENPDPWSLWNTITKMAKKRALVDVVLSATRSSGLFTQDPEAFDKWVDEAKDIIDGDFDELGGEQEFKVPRKGDAPPDVDPKTGEYVTSETDTSDEVAKSDPAATAPIVGGDGRIDWDAFWKLCKGLGFSQKEVFAVAKEDSLGSWSGEALESLVMELRDIAASKAQQRMV